MLLNTDQHIENQALYELRMRFKEKRARSRFDTEFTAIPNFQPTTFAIKETASEIELPDGHKLLYKEHRPFIGTGEYIITYQIIKP